MAELSVKNLRITFDNGRTRTTAVDGVSFRVGAERLGIVGESGSGKSQTARAVLGMVSAPGQVQADELLFDGIALQSLGNREWRRIRGKRIGMILQDPRHAMNPVKRVMDQMVEVAALHGHEKQRALQTRALDMLESIGVEDPARVARSYAHQLSGGLAQRVMIATMLLNGPELLIADEPTSALDVMVRAQVLQLLDGEIRRRGMGLILISHDLHTVARYCDRVLIMYRGRIVESCAADQLWQAKHPYTQGLLASLPSAATRGKLLQTLDRTALAQEVLHG